MDSVHIDKIRQVVFERLTVGESPDVLRAELRRKLDGNAADEILRDVIADIAVRRSAGTYETEARRIRKRKLVANDLAWRNLGFLLLGGGVIFTLISILAGAPALALLPTGAGFVILIVIEPKIRARMMDASAAVDRLLEEASSDQPSNARVAASTSS